MTTAKRNTLTAQATLCVPLALSTLTSAAQSIRDNNPETALQQIMDAEVHLNQLTPVIAEACEEAKNDDQPQADQQSPPLPA